MKLTFTAAQDIAWNNNSFDGSTPNMRNFGMGAYYTRQAILIEIITTLARYVDRPDLWSNDFILVRAQELNALMLFILEY